jgi:Raf kinase inhibitor-like YbhB/YbcL family protein
VRVPAVALIACALLAGCGGAGSSQASFPLRRGGLALTSPAFVGGRVDRSITCDGRETSPFVRIARVPHGTQELVLVLSDPDAPGGRFTHWAVAGIPPATRLVPAGRLPAGAVQGRNDKGGKGYASPCPPRGDAPHRYQLVVYALAGRSGIDAGASPKAVGDAVRRQRILAGGLLEARYGR